MIEVVTSRNALVFQNALRDMFRLRHRVLVERRGIERLRKTDGLLIDRFDTVDAVYLILTDDDGTVVGGSRLLPTTSPHVLSDVVQGACAERGVPRGAQIVELTRVLVDEVGLVVPAIEEARNRLIAGTFEFCLRAGFRKFTTLVRTDSLFKYLVIGLDLKPLGLPIECGGDEYVAVIVTVDQDAIDAVSQAYEIDGPLVRYVGAPDNDPLFLAPPIERQFSLEMVQ